MKEYISDPSRIVFACWEHKDITRMEDGVFRMAFTGQSFLSMSIDMSVDLQLWPAEDGTIKCKSVGYSVDQMAKLLGQVTIFLIGRADAAFLESVFLDVACVKRFSLALTRSALQTPEQKPSLREQNSSVHHRGDFYEAAPVPQQYCPRITPPPLDSRSLSTHFSWSLRGS